MGDDWFKKLSDIMPPHFSKEQFSTYLERQKEKMPFFSKHVPSGSKVLDIGCGFGYTSIPLSSLGYNMTCIDVDERVLDSISWNADEYGRKISIDRVNAQDIVKKYGMSSFDACISGGFLEHFVQEEIKELLEKQLLVAKLVVADIPIFSDQENVRQNYTDYEKRICKDGIYRNLWDAPFWGDVILDKFKIKYLGVSQSSKSTGSFEKLTFVLER